MKCRKNTKSKDPKVLKTKTRGIILLSKCAVCESKKPKCIKVQEAKGLLSKLTGIKVSILSKLLISSILV